MIRTAEFNWKISRADEYCLSVRDGTHDSPKFVDFGFPLVTSKHIKDGQLLVGDAGLVSEQDFDEINKRSRVDRWDVIFTMIGTIGEVYLVSEEEPRFAIKNVGLFKCGSEQRAKWLYYWFKNPLTKNALLQVRRGASQQYIPLGALRSLEIKHPQDEAAMRSVIDRIASFDQLIERNRRRIKLLEKSARLLYIEWFVRLRFPGHEHTKVVDGVPEVWARKTMADIAEMIGGGTPSTVVPAYWEGGDITWFSPTDLTSNDCLALLNSAKKITAAGLRNSSAKMLPPDAILMSSRASIGYFGLHDKPACTNQGFISLIPHDERYRYYLLYNLMSRKDEIESKAGGTTYKEINKSTFRGMSIIWPNAGVVEEFSEFAGDIMRQVRNLKQQTEKLSQARDLLLPRLMSGEITV